MSGPTPSSGTLPTDTPMDTSVAELLDLLRGRQVPVRGVGDGAVRVHRVCSDTRQLQPGDLYVALKGERFDGNNFLAQAQAAGAAAALAHDGPWPSGMAGLAVPDSLAALGELAAAWRARRDLPLIAVTGSNGKTTVTQMLASILRSWDEARTLATVGNFNNAIGLPLTLLRLRAGHRAAVVELGMNHPGEIAQLAAIARPTIGLVNNAQREHQEFMQTVEAVARENASVLAALPAEGVAVFPQDDAFSTLWRELAGGRRCMTFGEQAGADVCLQKALWVRGAWEVQLASPDGPLTLQLPILGRHNVRNALAAVACALAAGVPTGAIVQGLAAFRPVTGRMRALVLDHAARPVTLVDDAYNANPDSVRAAIVALSELPAPRLLVLGDMGEVGEQGPAFHAEVGLYAREHGIERLVAMGPLSVHAVAAFGDRGRHLDTIDALKAAVYTALDDGVHSLLIKGSRSMRMERVVAALEHGEKPQEAAAC